MVNLKIIKLRNYGRSVDSETYFSQKEFKGCVMSSNILTYLTIRIKILIPLRGITPRAHIIILYLIILILTRIQNTLYLHKFK